MCGYKLKESEIACPKCGTKVRVDRRLTELKKEEPELKKPNILTKETFLDKRKQRYIARRKKLGEELEPEVEKDVHLSLTPPETTQSFPAIEDLPDLDVSNINKKGLDDLDLSDIDLSKLENIGGVSKEQEVSLHKTVSCNNCDAIQSKIVYCPYCGKQFCSDCSPSIDKKGDNVIYYCPKCGKKVILEK